MGSDLITTRRVIFTPNVEIKEELKRTAINITCYDRSGQVVKRVTSSDDANIEDPEGNENENENQNGSGNTGNGGSGTGTGGSGTGTGGNTGGNTGGGTGGDGGGGGDGENPETE